MTPRRWVFASCWLCPPMPLSQVRGGRGPLPKKIKNSRAPRPWSPLFAAARATYRRSPLLSAVRAARPRAAVLYTFSQLCLGGSRPVTPRTAAVAAAAVLPAPAQRLRPRGGGSRPRRGRRGRRAGKPRTTRDAAGEPRYALVTGCRHRSARPRRALAARGYGVVVVAERDGPGARGRPALAAEPRRSVRAGGRAGSGSQRRGRGALVGRTARAPRVGAARRLRHAPSATAPALAGTGEGTSPPAIDAAEPPPDGLPGDGVAAASGAMRNGGAAHAAFRRRHGGAAARSVWLRRRRRWRRVRRTPPCSRRRTHLPRPSRRVSAGASHPTASASPSRAAHRPSPLVRGRLGRAWSPARRRPNKRRRARRRGRSPRRRSCAPCPPNPAELRGANRQKRRF